MKSRSTTKHNGVEKKARTYKHHTVKQNNKTIRNKFDIKKYAVYPADNDRLWCVKCVLNVCSKKLYNIFECLDHRQYDNAEEIYTKCE